MGAAAAEPPACSATTPDREGQAAQEHKSQVPASKEPCMSFHLMAETCLGIAANTFFPLIL